MPKQVQNPNVSRQLVEQFGIVGRMRPALDEIIVPVVQIGDLGAGAPPPITRRASYVASEAAVVAEYATIELRVPPGIGAKVERFFFRPSPSGAAIKARFYSDGTLAFGNGGQGYWTDGRNESSRAAGRVNHDTTAGFAQERWTIYSPTTGVLVSPVNWIVAGINGADGVIQWQVKTADLALSEFTVEWTEFLL